MNTYPLPYPLTVAALTGVLDRIDPNAEIWFADGPRVLALLEIIDWRLEEGTSPQMCPVDGRFRLVGRMASDSLSNPPVSAMDFYSS